MCSFDTVGIDSVRKTPGWAFGQNHQVMSSGDWYSCIQSWTTKKRRKSFTNTPFVAVLSVSRSRLSVATATRSSSAGLEGTLSFLPNGRTSNLPTSKNRVGIRFSVDWECRLLVYRWWQREVTIWGLGRRTIVDIEVGTSQGKPLLSSLIPPLSSRFSLSVPYLSFSLSLSLSLPCRVVEARVHKNKSMQLHYGVCHGRIRSSSSMTHNHSLFRSLCTQRWTRACSLSPEAPSFWLAFQAWPALCMHVFVKVQCSTLASTLEDKCFSFFSTDWRWQWWRTSNSAVTAFIAKRPRVAYSCSYVLLVEARVHKNKSRQLHYGVCHGRIRSSSSMTHNHSLFRSLCTQRWTRACSLSPEAPSFWLAFQAWPALCMHVFVKVQCSTLGSTLEDKCFSFFSTDWPIRSPAKTRVPTLDLVLMYSW